MSVLQQFTHAVFLVVSNPVVDDAIQDSTLVYHAVSLVAGNPVVGMSAEIIIIMHGKPGQYSSIPMLCL
jgi:hypothetical protein